MLSKVIDLDKGESAIANGWPIKVATRHDDVGDDDDDGFRKILEGDGMPGKKHYQVSLSHPQDYIGFKAQHKNTMSDNLRANGGKYYKINPHLGIAGYSNLFVVYWHWERKNRPKPPAAVQVLSNMPGLTGAGLGSLWSKPDQRHVITVVASKQNAIVQSGWPVIKEWNGSMTLDQLGTVVRDWYNDGAPGAPGKGPGGMDGVGFLGDLSSFVP